MRLRGGAAVAVALTRPRPHVGRRGGAALRGAGGDRARALRPGAARAPSKTRVTNAKASDEVIVAAGTYDLSKSLQTPIGASQTVDIHGAEGGAMPTIVASTTNSAWAIEFRGAGGSP